MKKILKALWQSWIVKTKSFEISSAELMLSLHAREVKR